VSDKDKDRDEEPRSRRQRANADAVAGVVERMPWEQILDESAAWHALTDDLNLLYTDSGFTAGQTVTAQQAADIANAAESILDGRGWRVNAGTVPMLIVGVQEV
jgi:hypothetical protein